MYGEYECLLNYLFFLLCLKYGNKMFKNNEFKETEIKFVFNKNLFLYILKIIIFIIYEKYFFNIKIYVFGIGIYYRFYF